MNIRHIWKDNIETDLDKHRVRMNTYPKNHFTREWYVYLYRRFMTCVTWQLATPCGNEHTKKPRQANRQGRTCTIVVFGWRSWQWQILAFFPLRIFRFHKKQHRSDDESGVGTVSADVWETISHITTLVSCKKVPFLRECGIFFWEQSANIPMFDFCQKGSFLWRITTQTRTEKISINCSFAFKRIGHHKWDLAVKSFGIMLASEYSNTDLRDGTKLVLWCWNDFRQPCPAGNFSFQTDLQCTVVSYR